MGFRLDEYLMGFSVRPTRVIKLQEGEMLLLHDCEETQWTEMVRICWFLKPNKIDIWN